MAPGTPLATLRPLSGPEVVDAGVQLGRQHYAVLLTASAVPLVPYFAWDVWSSRHLGATAFWPTIVFASVWASLSDAAAVSAAAWAYAGEQPDVARALRAAGRRAWAVIISGVYRSVMATVGTVLLVVPGLYVLATYALVPGLAVLEPTRGAWGTLRRSAALTRGAHARALGCYVLPYAFVVALDVVATSIISRLGEGARAELVAGMAGTVTSMLLTPFIAGIQTVFYYDLRVRKEAYDLEAGLAALAAPGLPPPGGAGSAA
jgi:hypothetical protein